MSETRVITPGELAGIFFGYITGLIGSIDDENLKGNILTTSFESNDYAFSVDTATSLDFLGQQILVGETVYFLNEVTTFDNLDTRWFWDNEFKGVDMEDAFNASETVTVIFDFRAEQYTTPQLVKPYGNQGTIVGGTVDIDLDDLGDKNFTVANTVIATNLPPGFSETDSVVTGTLTDNTGPFEVLVTATNSIGTTTTTFTWNTYRLNTNTRIITSGNVANLFGFGRSFMGSMDDDTLKGVDINVILEQPTTIINSMVVDVPFDFIGQQSVIGATTYFIKDASFDGIGHAWFLPFKGNDLTDGFNSSTPVPLVYNINGVNTFFNSAINSDINTPIPFPPHFDNR